MSDAIASSSSAWPSLLQTAGPSADPQGFPLQTTGSPSPRRALVLRAHHLKDLIRNLDIAVYAELSAIYYMDCSALRLLLRVVPHWLLLTPKSPLLPPMPPRVLPLFVFLTILSNVLGFFLHAFLHAPVSTAETTRGYLHGSLAIDFVGEKGPISKWRLGALDLLVMALQMAMVGLVLETRRLEKTIRDSGNAATAGQPNGDSPDGENRQDVEAEERGVRRSSEGYELRRLDSISAPNASEDGDEPRDEDDPLNTAQPPAVLAERELDALRSARALIADVSLSEAFWKLTRMHFSLELG